MNQIYSLRNESFDENFSNNTIRKNDSLVNIINDKTFKFIKENRTKEYSLYLFDRQIGSSGRSYSDLSLFFDSTFNTSLKQSFLGEIIRSKLITMMLKAGDKSPIAKITTNEDNDITIGSATMGFS